MPSTLGHNWPFILVPIVVTVAGGLLASYLDVTPAWRSGIQHFTAGVVVAAIAGEVIPDVIDRHAPLATVTGFVLGVAAMFGLGKITEGAEESALRRGLPLGLLAAVAVDGLIDGLVIGIGFTVGTSLGLLVTFALSLEMFFLGMSTAAVLRSRGTAPSRASIITSGAALMIALGATLGVTVFGQMSTAGLAGVLAFGSAALLYLVTEELLVEAHSGPETRAISSLFFAGFLTLLIVEMTL